MPEPSLVIRLIQGSTHVDLPATLLASGAGARPRYEAARGEPGIRLLLAGFPAYAVTLASGLEGEEAARLGEAEGRLVRVIFAGRPPLRRRLQSIDGLTQARPPAAPVELSAGRPGAAPLFLLPDGSFASSAEGPPPRGMAALPALLAAARWISTRRTTTFERLFAVDAFHPEVRPRSERLTAGQAAGLLAQIDSALAAAAVTGEEAKKDPLAAAQLRSASLTVLSHLTATVLADPSFRAISDLAASRIFSVVAAEQDDPAARPQLRAHGILLLQLRGPALQPADRQRAVALLGTLLRRSPPYAELTGDWHFAFCSAHDFHEGECDVLVLRHGFTEVSAPPGAPASPDRAYRYFKAPFKNPSRGDIFICARAAQVSNENEEMGNPWFHGLLINRHAQLGSFDLRAVLLDVEQKGYKFMMNSQCAGLTTRFALSRLFPDADIYSSWDSTYFRTEGPGSSGKLTASEGCDCFVAGLRGMAVGETHAQIQARMRRAQWDHGPLSRLPDFSQFIGPASPLVVQRTSDVNRDGKADLYDGFLDLQLRQIAEDVRASATPRDPGAASSAIGGEAATGLGWAAGSLGRVSQYSDLWAGLPGNAERLYAFTAGGFYSHLEPPVDVAVASPTASPTAATAATAAPAENLGLLPSVCRWTMGPGDELRAEVMLHSWLSHSGKEYKRLVCTAEAMWRAFDLGYIPSTGPLSTLAGRRGAVLLCLAGLLEFPADQNQIDALWSAALKGMALPDISRSVVRNCITDQDHDASNYYGSARGIRQLLGDERSKGDLGKADMVAWTKLHSTDPRVGRAQALSLDAPPPVG